jgi:hypothetical protein
MQPEDTVSEQDQRVIREYHGKFANPMAQERLMEMELAATGRNKVTDSLDYLRAEDLKRRYIADNPTANAEEVNAHVQKYLRPSAPSEPTEREVHTNKLLLILSKDFHMNSTQVEETRKFMATNPDPDVMESFFRSQLAMDQRSIDRLQRLFSEPTPEPINLSPVEPVIQHETVTYRCGATATGIPPVSLVCPEHGESCPNAPVGPTPVITPEIVKEESI